MSQLLKELQKLKQKIRILIILLITLAGCQGYSVTGGPGPLVANPLKVSATPAFKADGSRSVLVFPLQNGVGVNLSEEDLDTKTRILQNELEGGSSYTVINNIEARSTNPFIEEAKKLRQPLANQARRAGILTKAQLVLYGTLNRYAPLKGASSPQSPIKFSGSIETADLNNPQSDLRGGVASQRALLPGGVGFNLVLINPVNGVQLWAANFDIQEASVAQNIFQIKQQLELGKQEDLDQIFRLGVRSAVKQLELEKKASVKR